MDHALGASEILKLKLSAIDKDWGAYLLGLWPALFAPGALMTVVPESIVLLIAGKKIVNWYGMLLVFAGALAAGFGLARLRGHLRGGIARRVADCSMFVVASRGVLGALGAHSYPTLRSAELSKRENR